MTLVETRDPEIVVESRIGAGAKKARGVKVPRLALQAVMTCATNCIVEMVVGGGVMTVVMRTLVLVPVCPVVTAPLLVETETWVSVVVRGLGVIIVGVANG